MIDSGLVGQAELDLFDKNQSERPALAMQGVLIYASLVRRVNKSPIYYLASKGENPPGWFPRARVRAIKWHEAMTPTQPVVPIKAKAL